MSGDLRHRQFTAAWLHAQAAVAAYLSTAITDPHLVDDLLQELAMLLYDRWQEYDPGKPFLPWALGFARFKILEQYRRGRRDRLRLASPEHLSLLAAPGPAQADGWSAESDALRHCLQEVQGRSWDILRRRYHDDQDATTIAQELAMPAATVRSLLKRARDALVACVGRRLGSREAAP